VVFIQLQKDLYQISFYRARAYRDPTIPPLSITDSVTSHCITLTLLGSTIKLQEPETISGDTKLGTPRAQTHHWHATPKQQAPQITTTTEHKLPYAEKKLNDARCIETCSLTSLHTAPAPLLVTARLPQHLCHHGVVLVHHGMAAPVAVVHGPPQWGLAELVHDVHVGLVDEDQLCYVFIAISRCKVESSPLARITTNDRGTEVSAAAGCVCVEDLVEYKIVCVECLIGKQKKPILFKVTECVC
jgi:hypothetical protein